MLIKVNWIDLLNTNEMLKKYKLNIEISLYIFCFKRRMGLGVRRADDDG